jgi:hypothetical protein
LQRRGDQNAVDGMEWASEMVFCEAGAHRCSCGAISVRFDILMEVALQPEGGNHAIRR